METPKDRLFVFTPEELKTFKLVTAAPVAQAPAVPPASASRGAGK
jgi:hypothetical protein